MMHLKFKFDDESDPSHKPYWKYTNERASGSLVMYTKRTCEICGYSEETIKTPYDSWFNKRIWYKVK